MAESIKIDVKQIQEDLVLLQQSIKDFEPYSKTFIENTRTAFDEFNSDFISKMDGVIKHLSDDTAKELLEDVNDVYNRTKQLVDSFVTFDEEFAK